MYSVGHSRDSELSAIGVQRGIERAFDLPPNRAAVSGTPDTSFGVEGDRVVLWECCCVKYVRAAWVELHTINTACRAKARLKNSGVPQGDLGLGKHPGSSTTRSLLRHQWTSTDHTVAGRERESQHRRLTRS